MIEEHSHETPRRLSILIVDDSAMMRVMIRRALILAALLRKSPLNYGDLSTVQQTVALEKESK